MKLLDNNRQSWGFCLLIDLDCKVGNGKIYDSEFQVSFPEVNLLLALPE